MHPDCRGYGYPLYGYSFFPMPVGRSAQYYPGRRHIGEIDMHEQFIEVRQGVPGYEGFFGSWVCQDDITVVVDVGPANSVGYLIKALGRLGFSRVDYIFLTHIHIDHAGGLADVLDRYPMAKAICHEKAVKYLVEPSRLWAGSLKVLGDVAVMYGAPKPVSPERLIPHKEIDLEGLRIIDTPGHAAHHLSFHYKNRLFPGETGGNYFVFKGVEYLRPATPPRFFLDVSLKSLDRLLSLEDQPIRYPHFGGAEGSHRLLNRSRQQLLSWKDIIQAQARIGGEDLIGQCTKALLGQDPNLVAFFDMDSESQKRERMLITNSIRGFLGDLGENGQKKTL
jgi:glyoxylase-like metal-dependent hydrolase (beta-lactamase superfamily II)